MSMCLSKHGNPSNCAFWVQRGALPMLGHRPAMVAPLQNHSGIHNSTAGLNAAKPQHKLPTLSSKTPVGAATIWSSCLARRRQAPPNAGFQVRLILIILPLFPLPLPPCLTYICTKPLTVTTLPQMDFATVCHLRPCCRPPPPTASPPARLKSLPPTPLPSPLQQF